MRARCTISANVPLRRGDGQDPRIDVSCLEAVIGTRCTPHSTPLPICDAGARTCALSGSWAPTIWRSSIAGKTGSGSPPRCRSQWSIVRRKFPRPCGACRAGACAVAFARSQGRPIGHASPACLGLPLGNEIESVLDRAAEPGRNMEGRKPENMKARRHWNIETFAPTCVL